MVAFFLKKILPAGAAVAAAWLAGKYLLPVAMPFLLGAAVAWLSEPAVRPLAKRLNRTAGAAIGVSLTLSVLTGVVLLVGAVAAQQVGRLVQGIPRLADTARQSLASVGNWLTELSEKAPRQLKPIFERTVTEFFSDGTVFLEQVTQRLPVAVTSAIGTVGNGALSLGTGVVAAFLISARLPKLKAYLAKSEFIQQTKPAALRLRTALGGWLKAQLKLCAVTWGIVSAGFLLLRLPGGIWWAAAVALVDAVPILGTGTILVPWAVVCLLQGQSLRAIGLLCTYGAALMTRTVLEPKLVGNQLGLDPLATLGALYVGYRFWGFPGLILTPILASVAKSLLTTKVTTDN